MHTDERLIIGALLGIGFGLYLFYRGFVELKFRRLVAGIAISKVRSLAMGTSQLCGTAACHTPLTDPIYQQPCVYFKIKIERYEKKTLFRNAHWETIFEDNSDETPFYLVDPTGKVLVYPFGASFYFKKDVNFTSNVIGRFFGSLEDPLERFIRGAGGDGLRPVRVQAYIVRECDPVLVLGYAAPQDHPITPEEHAAAAEEAAALSDAALARILKSDPTRMRALDKNMDGRIDEGEWDEGFSQFKEEARTKASTQPQPAAPIVVRRGPDGLLLLADESPESLDARLGWRAFGQVFGGAGLVLASGAFLFQALGQ